ncbi:MAG: DHA2 family efflux MFS transporter permease subunit [Proteobacteria bacterium]|nr:DHA2 family efflux MFS transporter permease subunit [Pseudomonadota bacterium]
MTVADPNIVASVPTPMGTGAVANQLTGFERFMIMVVIMMSTIVIALDMSIATIALPHMQGGLSATQDQVAWVMTSYLVSMSVMIAYTGWLANRIGRKRLLVAALTIFSTGAMFSGQAATLEEMMLFRVIQGIAAAPVFPLAQAIILDSFPRRQQGQVMALWGLGVMTAPVLGPVVGGWVTGAFDWRWVFYLGVPLGFTAAFMASAFIVDVGQVSRRKFDWIGFSALAMMLAAVQLLLDRGHSQGWFESTEVVIEASVIGLGFYIFATQTATSRNPIFARALFTNANYMIGMVFAFMVGAFMLSGNYVLTVFLQNIQGYPVTEAGMMLAPRAFGTMLGLLVVGLTITRVDPRALIAIGFALISVSAYLVAGINSNIDTIDFAALTLFNGFGAGLIWAPMITLMFATLEPVHRTEASTLVNLIRGYGSGVGISIGAVVLTRSSAIAYAELIETITPYNEVLRMPQAASAWNLESIPSVAALEIEVVKQATTIGVLNTFILVAVAAGLVVPLVLLLRRPAENG